MDMDNLPTEEQQPEQEAPSPLFATLEAMGRLKKLCEQQATAIAAQEVRIKNLEDAFQMVFKNGAASLQEFLAQLPEAEGEGEGEGEGEEGDEIAVQGETDDETEDSGQEASNGANNGTSNSEG